MNFPDYDDSTAFLGDWGRFQKTVFFLLCLSIIPNGFTGLSMVFMGDTPAHRCLIPAALNITDEWRNAAIPLEEDEENRDSRFSKCSRHRMDVVKSYSDRGLLPWVDVNVSDIAQEGCLDGWEYDTGTYISTIVSEVRFTASLVFSITVQGGSSGSDVVAAETLYWGQYLSVYVFFFIFFFFYRFFCIDACFEVLTTKATELPLLLSWSVKTR